MDLVLGLHARINEQPEDNGTQQKIRMAETYIKENYNTDLNMAVVSNYISMIRTSARYLITVCLVSSLR